MYTLKFYQNISLSGDVSCPLKRLANFKLNWSQRTAKHPTRSVLPAKTQISLNIHQVCHVFALLPLCITKTRLYNFDPLKPNFYTVKLGFTGYALFFLFLLKNIDCGYSLEPPRRCNSNEYPQSMIWAEIWKYQNFFIWKSSSFGGKIFSIFE